MWIWIKVVTIMTVKHSLVDSLLTPDSILTARWCSPSVHSPAVGRGGTPFFAGKTWDPDGGQKWAAFLDRERD